MKHIIIIVIIVFTSTLSSASNHKGVYKGPYLLATGGVQYFTEDNIVRTASQVGRNFEPAAGIHFGWNLIDEFAPELEARYSTNKNMGKREHIVTININAVYNVLFDPLLRPKLKIIPFLQGGPALQFASVPNDPLASSTANIGTWGPGIGFGGGIRFLFAKYVLLGFVVQADVISFDQKIRDVAGSPTTVLSGGWKVEPSFAGNVGVHF